jgi:hypothetical protein
MTKKEKTLRPLSEDQLKGARGGDLYYTAPSGGFSFWVIAFLTGTGAGGIHTGPVGPGPGPGGQ